jgi:PQQ-dependent catabolism-associated beta-propeller protein
MGVSADGRLVVNTSESSSMVHVIDAASYRLLGSVLVDARPRSAQFTPDGKTIWASSELRGTVSVIDVATRKITGKVTFAVPGISREAIQAVGVVLTRDGTRAYVALGPANRVAEVDVKTLQVTRYYLVGQRVWQLALSSDEKRLYTANGNSGDVSVIDLDAHEVIKSIRVGRSPWGVAVAP